MTNKVWIGEESNQIQVSYFDVSKILRGKPEFIASVIGDLLNTYGDYERFGEQVGEALRMSHRALQRSAVCFLLGCLVGISRQEFTDPRNETAIETAQKIAQMIDDGDLPVGPFV